MTILEALSAFDGKNTFELERALQDSNEESRQLLIAELIQTSNKISAGAVSWLIKHAFEQQDSIEQDTLDWLSELLIESDSWQSQLHALQLFEPLTLLACFKTKTQRKTLHNRLLWLLDSQNKFVKAWAYNALIVVSFNDSAYRKEVSALVKLAQSEERGAITARIRNALKKYPLE